MKKINNRAERLHLGVYYERKAGPQGKYEDACSDKAILLASMVDALGAVFNMLVEAIRVARACDRQSGGLPWGSKVAFYGDEACRLLKNARNQLIAEAMGATPSNNVGLLVTPASILIVIMERLTRGVFGTGSVDIINILEECLEKLVSVCSRRIRNSADH